MKLVFKYLFGWFTNLIRNSKYRWVILAGSLLYFISPLDISPDIFPIIGWLDDGLVSTILITELSQIIAEKTKKNQAEINQE